MVKNNIDKILLAVIILILFIYKYSFLHLPYYWDEAWSYKPAVEEMVKHGPSLLPGSISVENYKGHPLFFYFLSSLWLSIFPDNIFWSKLFAFAISSLTIIYTYLLAKQIYNKQAGVISALLLSVQVVFVAQSSLLLPEMLLALLSLMSFYYYFKNKTWAFILSSSFLLLTKETGFVALLVIYIYDFFTYSRRNSFNVVKYLKNSIVKYIPVLPLISFLIYQKVLFGWFFYPTHIAYINLSEFFDKFSSYFAYLFIYQGRNVIFFSTILVLIYILIKKIKIDLEKQILFLLFIVLYISFLSLNFYSTRYILSAIPFFVIIISSIVLKAISNKILQIILLSVFVFSPAFYGFTHLKDSDHNIGYENVITVQKKMVDYCEKENLFNTEIATHFLMKIYMTDSLCGYLSSSQTFKISDKITASTKYVIVSSNEQNDFLNQQLSKVNKEKVVEFTEKQASCTLFRIKVKD